MTNYIWKFDLPADPGQHPVKMPASARLLSCGWQGGRIVFWASCTPSSPSVTRLLEICFTGNETPLDADYIGTIQAPNGLVYHVFEQHP